MGPLAQGPRHRDPGRSAADYHELGLGADGVLAAQPQDGGRELLCLGTGLGRSRRARKSDPPSVLCWETAPLAADLNVAGDIELRPRSCAASPRPFRSESRSTTGSRWSPTPGGSPQATGSSS